MAGILEEDYLREGRYIHEMEEILRPFEMTVKYIKADYQPFFALYGTEDESESGKVLTDQQLRQSGDDYLQYLRSLARNNQPAHICAASN